MGCVIPHATEDLNGYFAVWRTVARVRVIQCGE
jgi:hypothetical protein